MQHYEYDDLQQQQQSSPYQYQPSPEVSQAGRHEVPAAPSDDYVDQLEQKVQQQARELQRKVKDPRLSHESCNSCPFCFVLNDSSKIVGICSTPRSTS